MPLDPFFAERLRVHRRYLLRRWWASVIEGLPRLRRSVEVSSRVTSQGGSPAASAPSPSLSPSRRRARHRRAALKWDRDEFATVALPGPDVNLEEHIVAAPGFPDVRVRLYRPLGTRSSLLPGVLTFFGGAFRIGGIDYPTTDARVRSQADGARVVMIAVDYALAPEHRFPTPVEQGLAMLRWTLEHAAELGVDASRIGIAGTSAGADIAASVALLARDRGVSALRLQVLEVPVLDLTGRHLDLRATWSLRVPALIVARELRSVARTYLRTGADARSPYASPLRAPDLTGLPPAVILTAEYDVLRRQGVRYADRLRRAGVPAAAVTYRGVTHDVPMFTRALAASRMWNDQVIAALARLHG